jgi:hypothetical protein
MNHNYILFNLIDEARNTSTNNPPTWNIVVENPDIVWNYMYLSINPTITWDVVRSNRDKNWRYDLISGNPIVNWDIIKNNPDIKWFYPMMSRNPNISWDIVEANPDKPWSYKIMSRNTSIPLNLIIENLDKGWNCKNLSSRPDITWSIAKHIDQYIEWPFEQLGKNPHIVKEVIDLYPEDIHYISCSNPGITYKEIVDLGININYSDLVINPNLTWDEVMKHKKFKKMDVLVCANCVTIEKIKQHPEFRWSDKRFNREFVRINMRNKNLTWKIIMNNRHMFKFNSDSRICKFNRWNTASKIQHKFRQWRYKIELEASTQFLYSILNKNVSCPCLPIELTHHISVLKSE